MSKPKYDHVLFEDEKGTMCAIRQADYSEKQAEEIAKKAMFTENVKRTHEYSHMYYGYGKSDGESQSSWWLIDNMTKNAVPVFVFREIID